MITPDIALSLFLCSSLLCFIVSTRSTSNGARLGWLYAFYTFAGLAFLTKGLIAVVFPALIIISWTLLLNNWRQFRHYFPVIGILIFLIIVLPWHILVQIKNPDFFQFYFMEQHVLRYMTNYAERGQPFWFITAVVFIGFFPWIIFLLLSPLALVPKGGKWLSRLKNFWQQRKNHSTRLFLILWIFIIWLFFTLSHSQLLSYALPIMTPLAIITGRYFALIWRHNTVPAINLGFTILLILGAGASLGAIIMVKDPTNYWYFSLILLMATVLIAAACTWHGNFRIGIFALVLSLSLCLISVNLSYSSIDKRSVKTLALTLKPLLKNNEEVFAFGTYYQDLPVYLEKLTSVVNYHGELLYGMLHQPEQNWIISGETLVKKWRKKDRVFMIMGYKDYFRLNVDSPLHRHMYPLAQTEGNILVTNHPQ